MSTLLDLKDTVDRIDRLVYLDEAIQIMIGTTALLPERAHLLALREYYQERIERARTKREAEPMRRVL